MQTTNKIVPPFNFSAALATSVEDRFTRSIAAARSLLSGSGYQDICDFPCVPSGAAESEIAKVEADLGVALPVEYRSFLARHRYLKIDDGLEIGGLDHDGTYVTETPWISNEHRVGISFLVFANYWVYADGDQLMFDLSVPSTPVIAYLHEHGPLFELFAPSFSTALWRLVQVE